jgi:hypothetical protein
MRTCGDLFPQVCEFANLLAAYRQAARGKRTQDGVGRFGTEVERELLRLREELRSKSYRPGSYKTKMIHHPKRRMISAAPFRDRVVHHALCRVAMPHFERKMIHDLYSNRAGKGTHAAIRRAQEFSRRYPLVLKCDVRKFFPSMDHALLKAELRRTIRCADTLWLFDTIIDASNPQEPVCCVFPGDDIAEAALRRVGLPIGNLTSQWFGGIYLTRFDHWVKEALGCPGYVRYVDDILLFANCNGDLAEWKGAIFEMLASFRLSPNIRKTRVFHSSEGITFLGQRIWPTKRRIARPNVVSARRRLLWNAREHLAGRLDREGLVRRWASWKGHASQADGHAVIEHIRDALRAVLARQDKHQSGFAGRVVEQLHIQPGLCCAQQQQPVEQQQQQWVPVRQGDRGGCPSCSRQAERPHPRLRAEPEIEAHQSSPVLASETGENEQGKLPGPVGEAESPGTGFPVYQPRSSMFFTVSPNGEANYGVCERAGNFSVENQRL